MKSILWVGEAGIENANEVGYGASVLGELVKNDILVPNTFIITASSFLNFLEEADIKMKILEILNTIDINEEEELKEKSKKIQDMIKNAETPWELDADIIHAYRTLSQKSGLDREVVVVRCCITTEEKKTFEWQESFLAIKNERELLKKVKQCWESYFSPSAISNRIEHGLKHENTSIAIIVQKMINSSVCGTLLTSYPTNNLLTIESIYGISNAQQQIIPDKYLVSKELIIEDKTIGKQMLKYCLDEEGNFIKEEIKELGELQKLSDEQIIKLTEIGIKIEELFNEPMNIEWCFDEKYFYVISAKSIISKKFEKVEEKVEEWVEEELKEFLPAKFEEKVEEIMPITATEIFLDIEKEIEKNISKLPIQGVLLNENYIITNLIKKHPLELIKRGNGEKFVDILAKNLLKIGKEIYPKKFILKLNSLTTEEYRNLINGEKFEIVEKNPKLGLRGGSRYFYKDFKEVFGLERKAIKKVCQDLKNVWITVPFIRNIDEAKKVIEFMNQENLTSNRDFKIFMNVDIPSNIFLVEEFAEHFDGFTMDLNNLAQFIFGVDKDSEIKDMVYDIRDDAVKIAIKYFVKNAHKKGCKVLISGKNLFAYHDFLESLIRVGVDGISFSSQNIEEGIRIVASLEKKILLGKLRDKSINLF